jgi:hypothetical protein
VCRAANASAGCDVDDSCDGVSPHCGVDVVAVRGTLCRASRGACDTNALCSGASKQCPSSDATLRNASVVCRAAAGPCDVEERCAGDVGCPRDAFRNASIVCRAPQSQCDKPERCSGATASCADDRFQDAGFLCNDNDPCTTPDACTSVGVCRGAYVCECRADVDCDDGNPCTADRCTTDAGTQRRQCAHVAGNRGTLCRASIDRCDLEEV